jgi:hypothetical protein
MFKRFINEASYEAAIAGRANQKTLDLSSIRGLLRRYGPLILGLCLLTQSLLLLINWQRGDEIILEIENLKRQQRILTQASRQPEMTKEVSDSKELQPVLSELVYRGLIGTGSTSQAYLELDGNSSWMRVGQIIEGHGRIVGIYPQALVLEDATGHQRVFSLGNS